MITKKKIWESKRALLEHYESYSLLVKRYRQFLPPSEYRTALLKSLHYYHELNCNHLVVDSTFGGPVTENDIVWACDQYENFSCAGTLKKLFVVKPLSIYTQYSILEFQRRLRGCVPILVYDTLEDILDKIEPNLSPEK